MNPNESILFRSGHCSKCGVPTDFLLHSDSGLCKRCSIPKPERKIPMAKNYPNSIDSSDAMAVEVFDWAPSAFSSTPSAQSYPATRTKSEWCFSSSS